MAKVGVVIPAYNSERFLADAIRSLQSQTFRDWKAVVVDDGSQDKSAAVAENLASDDRRIRVVRQDNRGVCAARNRGFEELAGSCEYVSFLDADDLWLPNALDTFLGASWEEGCVGAHGFFEYCDEGGARLSPAPRELLGEDVYGYPLRPADGALWSLSRSALCAQGLVPLDPKQPTSLDCFLVSNCIQTPGLTLLRAEAFEKTGGFDSEYWPCEDWEFYQRLLSLGTLAFAPELILRFRLHAGNASSSGDRGANAIHRIRRRALSGHFGQERAQWTRSYLRREARLKARNGLKWCVLGPLRGNWQRARAGWADWIAGFGA
ncbi:MAG: glycosyltransferase family 2 protein [Fimbriimonadaceae bacterium]|nr:glycosyltransferase family 2 protein [Fimbriimonadaceae bacterium]QOJ11356.1 MAG: glycosyltransferase family 2 protein [Chthonomonadaceae bacterium]